MPIPPPTETIKFNIVGKEGLEPSRPFEHQPLKLTRLPVPPPTDVRKNNRQGGTRTHTPFRAPAPKAGVSSIPPLTDIAGRDGLEPPTNSFGDCRPTNWSNALKTDGLSATLMSNEQRNYSSLFAPIFSYSAMYLKIPSLNPLMWMKSP